MFNLIRKYRKIPEEKKIIVYGKVAFIKNLFYFFFKILVGAYYHSWFLIAIAIYSLFIGLVKNNCSRGLKRNKESINDIYSYIQGGIILASSSVFYVAYSVLSIIYPSNTKYHMIIAIATAAFAFYSVGMSIWGVYKTKGKTMLIKEYKLTNFATAFNNMVLAQIAILSFTDVKNTALYNGIIGIAAGGIVLGIGIYLIIDGLYKRKKYNQIISRYPKFMEYINQNYTKTFKKKSNKAKSNIKFGDKQELDI